MLARLLSIGRSFFAAALESLVVLVCLMTLVFLCLRFLPGDPALLVLGEQASPRDVAAMHAKLHLDRSLIAQYTIFLCDLATLDHGDSLRLPGVPAMTRVAKALLPTAGLAVWGTSLGALFGVTTGTLAYGPWFGTKRRFVRPALDVLASIPLLAFAPVVSYVLAVRLRVLPLPGDPDSGSAGLLFASGLLAIPLGAQVGRATHTALASIAEAPFLRVARAKGAGPLRVWFRHGLLAVMPPILTIVAAQAGALFGGAVVLEKLFERRGLGSLILESYASRDLPVLESAVFASGAIFVVVQSIAAALSSWVDPRGAKS
jgi:peptide/nickel transport system permease protein